MTVTIVALTTVNTENLDDVSTYLGTTTPLLDKAGARIVTRCEVARTIVGQLTPSMLTIVEYPNEDAIASVFESAEYGYLQEVRERAFLQYEVYQTAERPSEIAIKAALGATEPDDLG
ncbi:DUF1330 domain-containing protein [Aliishimia ponticola]|uniref:DUF1330 domain-containing protein n=1 Tax=Aliishimia ponticola TaxID=2499833 RepID=A0A4S4NHH0_9RHOB|nr:DUF1330 domain-containing protein [Aliishimia ponticola]THH38107.1 DUF1330 domain-containing protein [Aliishimia ponticola]